MSQLAYLEDFYMPPSPCSRPLRLPYHLEPPLYLGDNPEKLELGECMKDIELKQTPKQAKRSILKFLSSGRKGQLEKKLRLS